MQKIQSQTMNDLYENYNCDFDFKSIIETWNKYVPSDSPSFKELHEYINYNQDVKYKIVKNENSFRIQQTQ